MSEKIFACLLRLFPSAFRRQYEEEALQLLRDRLRDEKGLFSRLRLSFDLIADMVRALPQAYRNRYAEAVTTSSLRPHFDGIPSFRLFQNEPLRPGVIVIAGVLTFTALATFSYVLDRAIQDIPLARKGPISPIAAVLERLNEHSTDSIRSNDGEPDSADISEPEAQPTPAKNAALSPMTRIASDNQNAKSGEHKSNANYSDPGRLRAVAAPSSPASGGRQSAQSLPEAIRVVAQSAVPSDYNPISVQVLTDSAGVNLDDWLIRWNHETETIWASAIPKNMSARTPEPIVIRMKVSPGGRILDGSMMLEKRSGDAILDGAAWKALAASKYPPLPSDFHAQYLELRVTFSPKLSRPQ